MALKMRLSRGGSKKRPYYHIVVADARAPRDGRFIERIGSYNPLLGKDDEKRVQLDTEKAGEWLKKGAQPTERVARFLGTAGLVKWEHGDNPNKAKPGKKAQERIAEKEAAAEAAREAEEAAKAAAAEAAAAPAEEAPAEDATEEKAE
ncbi:30S ribosomal protein S16 [Aquisalinus flavus]|uniref:Small ribosomal subunit protein bS16 n=1 Tax=Aquisalinus flavus TaxID=1526572 RepID=A0A8J2V3L1_9PROT|nr:30S ribosomal protein S16 [Aquisalinus flavus]MBD0425663.1 30S ribosomal protein S16 [Aquisalinus flavus]UNE48722.1 30S ribosomal protein S16 [Aquisalinus flavus]GGD14236.1 hypothetical protein GCM10011342_23790 [Aquisalinus flavus]